MNKVIVIGGGAAGMAAAYAASFHVTEVLLLERNEKLGKKIYITGKGRGNLTNASDIGDFFKKIVHNPKFLYSALYGFSNEQLLALLEKYGLHTKVERGNRVFPVSDHASDITAAWERALKKQNVNIRLRCGVKEPVTESDGDFMRVRGVRTDAGEVIPADHVIVCTGGFSYPSTGSFGDGVTFAEDLGLNVTPIYPALVPFVTKEKDICDLSGLALKNVTLRVSTDKNAKKPLYSDFGELLFTHFGISGPLVLAASSYAVEALHKTGGLFAEIDLKPALSEKMLDERLLREIASRGKQSFARFFEGLVPKALGRVMVGRLGISRDKPIGDITKDERRRILMMLKAFPLTITATGGFNEAIITRGGINVKEIDAKTMRAKNVNGISFAGEVLDVDALTGGYNMQIAFSTGYLAGDALAENSPAVICQE